MRSAPRKFEFMECHVDPPSAEADALSFEPQALFDRVIAA